MQNKKLHTTTTKYEKKIKALVCIMLQIFNCKYKNNNEQSANDPNVI